MEATVKWFNLTKGFGFVSPADSSPDAFLHISVLTSAGLQQVAEGTKLLVEIGDGPKGRQIKSIISVLGQPAPTAITSDRPKPTGPTEEMTGTVKWYRTEKGFGFISPDDEGKDIFVHKTVIERIGLTSLETGQCVSMSVHSATKGREALKVALIDSAQGQPHIEAPAQEQQPPIEAPAQEEQSAEA